MTVHVKILKDEGGRIKHIKDKDYIFMRHMDFMVGWPSQERVNSSLKCFVRAVPIKQ